MALAAGIIRTLEFMGRYRSDLKTKPGKLRDLEKKFWEQSMGPRGVPQGGMEPDLEQAINYFALLGWRGDGEDAIAEDYLAALIK